MTKSTARSRAAAGAAAVVLLLVLLAPAAASAFVHTSVRVAMRDGTELATDVWRPDGAVTPLPVILRRTPYGRAVEADIANTMTLLGYVLVSQDVRGRGDSAGAYVAFQDDAHDGFDTIAWIAAQPFSNGRVGTYSSSAEGIVQLLAAGEGPEALRCVHAGVATGDVHAGLFPGGAWRTELTEAWHEGLAEPGSLAAYRAHEVNDAFWDPMRLDVTELARVDVPVLLFGGTFDIFASGTPETHRRLVSGASPSARADQFLVFGPWTHGGVGATVQGEVTFPADASYFTFPVELAAWFDWCLRDGPRPTWEPVRYYVMRLGDDGRSATGGWKGAAAWPPASTPATLHLHDDGVLAGAAPAAGGVSATLPIDPAEPVPSRGGGNLTTPAGPFDQADLETRPDVLTATTAPAVEEVELVGSVSARITAASATTDVDVIVRLTVVTPSGRSMLVADGIRRGRFVGGTDAIRPLVPGQAAVFDVDVGPVALVLPPGHALRVAISGTSSPRYGVNPGVAEPLASNPTPVATELTIFRDAARRSSVTLPVVRGTLPGWTPPDGDAGVPGPDGAPGLDAGHGAGDGGGGGGDGGGGGCGCRAAGGRAAGGRAAGGRSDAGGGGGGPGGGSGSAVGLLLAALLMGRMARLARSR